jgi:hypothetical protein
VNSPSTSQVRQWARAQGVQVGERGRLPADLVAQYLAAHGGRAPKQRDPAPASRRTPKPRPSSDGGPVVIGRTVNAKRRWDWNR